MPGEEADNWIDEEFQSGLVSVIVPTYNRAELLKETLGSLLRQDYRPMEIVIVDDGSTDSTIEMLEELKVPDGIELRLIRSEHEGASAARNKGAREAGGEFVMFHDSDDIMHAGAVAALVKGIAGADLAYGKWRDWFSSENPPRFGKTYARSPGADLVVDLLRNQWLLPSAVIHRRSCLRRIQGWDTGFSVEQDFEFMMRIALAGAVAESVPMLVSDYRRHDQGQLSTGSLQVRSKAMEEVLKRTERALDRDGWTHERREALAWRYWWAARMAWLYLPDHSRFHELLGEAHRVLPTFAPPKWWYRVIGKVAGYANAERVAKLGRKVFR